jgi:hypothetical protein
MFRKLYPMCKTNRAFYYLTTFQLLLDHFLTTLLKDVQRTMFGQRVVRKWSKNGWIVVEMRSKCGWKMKMSEKWLESGRKMFEKKKFSRSGWKVFEKWLKSGRRKVFEESLKCVEKWLKSRSGWKVVKKHQSTICRNRSDPLHRERKWNLKKNSRVP